MTNVVIHSGTVNAGGDISHVEAIVASGWGREAGVDASRLDPPNLCTWQDSDLPPDSPELQKKISSRGTVDT